MSEKLELICLNCEKNAFPIWEPNATPNDASCPHCGALHDVMWENGEDGWYLDLELTADRKKRIDAMCKMDRKRIV